MVSAFILTGRATRVPQAAVTNGIQRTIMVTPGSPLCWALASDLACWSRPKLHGMQGVTKARIGLVVPGRPLPPGAPLGPHAT
jgi:hypothetical protein